MSKVRSFYTFSPPCGSKTTVQILAKMSPFLAVGRRKEWWKIHLHPLKTHPRSRRRYFPFHLIVQNLIPWQHLATRKVGNRDFIPGPRKRRPSVTKAQGQYVKFLELPLKKKKSEARWLKAQKFISSQFWRLNIQDQGVWRSFSAEAPLLPVGCLLALSSHGLSSEHAHPWCLSES